MKSVAGQPAGQMGHPGNWKRRSDLHVPFQFQTGFIYMRKVFLLLQNHLDISEILQHVAGYAYTGFTGLHMCIVDPLYT